MAWSEPVTVMHGTNTGIGPANQALFYDKEWITVDNNPDSPFYGRAYPTATKFVNALHGSYAESGIFLSTSDDGGDTFTDPVPAAQLEDGASDMPFSVIGRQTVWGHQIRWAPYGNIVVDPNDPDHVTVIWADRGTPNPKATDACLENAPEAPTYDPCNAGPGSDLDVYRSDSFDGRPDLGRPHARRRRRRRVAVVPVGRLQVRRKRW